MKSISGDKLRGHLETVVLSCLEQSEAHGLELLRRIEASGKGFLRLKEGSLYPALYRLEASGLIISKVDQESTGCRGAKRRVYRLTNKGKRRLEADRTDWQAFIQVLGSLIEGAIA